MTESSVVNSICLTSPPKKGEKKLSIEVTYQWDITQSEWSDEKAHQETVEKDIQNKLEYDPVFLFHIFNDISIPSLKKLKLNGVTKKVKLSAT